MIGRATERQSDAVRLVGRHSDGSRELDRSSCRCVARPIAESLNYRSCHRPVARPIARRRSVAQSLDQSPCRPTNRWIARWCLVGLAGSRWLLLGPLGSLSRRLVLVVPSPGSRCLCLSPDVFYLHDMGENTRRSSRDSETGQRVLVLGLNIGAEVPLSIPSLNFLALWFYNPYTNRRKLTSTQTQIT